MSDSYTANIVMKIKQFHFYFLSNAILDEEIVSQIIEMTKIYFWCICNSTKMDAILQFLPKMMTTFFG
jgi:redox-regulated HSP33 family molecular chaperone